MPDRPLSDQDPIARDVVLVVEDERPNRVLLKATVDRATIRRVREAIVLEASTLAEARTIIATRQVDLIVLDVRLPDGDGLTLARDLNDSGRRPRILVLSASVLPSERSMALDAGTDAFMAKPFVPADVVETMAGLLDAGPVVTPAGRL
ncbi:MAG TPA: response regulator [Candidatus Limnocylindrales bacterium]|nr:response regulator [Candidatus Limnocylindrales bacterium]